MSSTVEEVLKSAIQVKRQEIAELETALRKLEEESAGGKLRRRRRTAGFKQGSVPFLVNEILTKNVAPMSAADLAEALKALGKAVTTNVIAGSLNRYMGKVFDRTDTGMYVLRA